MKEPKTLPLLVEIGCEEIPARFLEEAQKSFGETFAAALRKARLLSASSGSLQSYSTPRRLVAWVPEVLERQPEKVEELLGPPAKVGLDAAGKPTRAAESFAQKNGARVTDLVRVTTPKGEYLALRKGIRGRPANRLLPEILPSVIASLSFPKSMNWVGKSGLRFVRPIRWLLALLGEGKQARVIPFQIAGVKAANVTFGQRAMGKRGIRVQSFKQYAERLRQAQVEFSPQERRRKVGEEVKVLLDGLRLTHVPDKWLEDWIVNSTEWPKAILGQFDTRYLRLPREILITVMRDHQKYFAVEDRQGNLQPRFVAILNQQGDREGLIRQGHERVLAARFTDAEFFWETDQRVLLRDRQPRLAQVTYQAELGSYADKIRRINSIATHLCAALEAYPTPFLPVDTIDPDNAKPRIGTAAELVRFVPLHTQRIMRAIELSKCDLTTQMVQEFPELQGVVGGLYARAQGESSQVADAIYEHYLPQGAEDRCPRTIIGAVVSLADKLDSVAGGFAVGHAPSGSSDPFALRRAGNGIIKVLLELSLPISLKQAVEEAIKVLEGPSNRPRHEVFAAVMEFLGERLRYYFETVRRLRYDTVRAVLAAGWDVPREALGRVEALEAIRDGENFAALSIAAKRIKNILAKSATVHDWEPGEVDEAVLREKPEEELYHAYRSVAQEADQLGRAGQHQRALEAIATLRPTVDRFFDKVLVMAEDPALRQNRLRLLGKLDELFSGLAHFAEIATGPGNVDASTSKTVQSDR